MIGMLIVFATAFAALRIRGKGISRSLVLLTLFSIAAGGVFYLEREDMGVKEYFRYAETTVSGGTERFNTNVIGGVLGTLEQAGIWGNGLGTATQGGYHIETAEGVRNWQEDGVSRLLAETGLIGTVLLLLSVGMVAQASIRALKRVPAGSPIQDMQIGLASVIGASCASLVISHQAFSGDPCALLLVSVMLGVFLSGPEQVSRKLPTARVRRSFLQVAQCYPTHV
jgi:hypothetical protein